MVITRTVGATVFGATHRATTSVELSYDSHCPLAVGMAIETSSHWVEWTFARDLLVDGISERAGVGDVRVEPDRFGTGVWVELSSPAGHVRMLLARADVVEFIDLTIEQVRLGEEQVDLDALEWEVRL